MKKFSKLTGQTVSETPKELVKETTQIDLMKARIMQLMDNYLKVQLYGPVTRYQVAGTVKVVGKEMFLEALLDTLTEFTTSDKVKLLESLKLETTDWKAIDEKIDSLNQYSNEVSNSKLISHKAKVKSILSKSKNEEEILENFTLSLNKIKNPNTAYLRSIAIKHSISENRNLSNILYLISEHYLNKAKELGYVE